MSGIKEMRKRIGDVLILCFLAAGLVYAAREADNGGRMVSMAKGPEAVAEESSMGAMQGKLITEGTVSGNDAAHTVSGNGVPEGDVSGNDVPQGDVSGNDAEESEYANLAIADVEHYVNVRSTPDTNGEILGKMYDGSVAQILSTAGENGEWFQVVSGNVEGYIKAEYFIYGDDAAAVIDDYVTRYAQVCVDRLNVRQEPDIEAKRIGYVDKGEKVKILEDCGEWLKVQYTDSREGYIAGEYVTVWEEFIYAKSIEEERAELEAQRALAEREKVSEQAAPEQTASEQTTEGQEAVGTTENVIPPDTSYATNDELRASIVEYASQYLGNAYVHGGSSLENGTDCSGFTCFVYAEFGYSISRTPSGQYSSAGRSIDYSEAKPGDIICYSSGGKGCTHVGLYIGDGQIIHEANSRKGVIISNADYSTIIGVKNVID